MKLNTSTILTTNSSFFYAFTKIFYFLSISFLTLSFASSLLSINILANPKSNFRFVTGSAANLRDAPCGKILSVIPSNSEGLTVADASGNCKLTIDGKTTDNVFISVKMNDGKTGFIDTGLMIAVTAPAQPDPVSLNGKFVTTDALKLRESICGKVITVIPQGAVGTMTSEISVCNLDGVETAFVKVKLDDGKVGYLAHPYLSTKVANTPKTNTVASTVRTGGDDLNKVSNSNKTFAVTALTVSGLIASLIGGGFIFKKTSRKSEQK